MECTSMGERFSRRRKGELFLSVALWERCCYCLLCLESRRSAGSFSCCWVSGGCGGGGQRGRRHVCRRQGEDGLARRGDGGHGRRRRRPLLQDRPEQRCWSARSDNPQGDKGGGDIQVRGSLVPKTADDPNFPEQGRPDCDRTKSRVRAGLCLVLSVDRPHLHTSRGWRLFCIRGASWGDPSAA